MAHRQLGNAFNDAMELLIVNGFDGMADMLTIPPNKAMEIGNSKSFSCQKIIPVISPYTPDFYRTIHLLLFDQLFLPIFL